MIWSLGRIIQSAGRMNKDLADLMPIELLQKKRYTRNPDYLDRKRERYTIFKGEDVIL